ncbi:hypothetical protein AX15_001197 [Amanita polypyramis BW_CC]|nr:hypothetical protein AX15_001197 [Amanita polypyramis BW_CC]
MATVFNSDTPPSLAEVIVTHQGTDIEKTHSILTDIKLIQKNLGSTLFPGVDSSIKVHRGFADEPAKTASDVLSAVRSALSSNKVTTVGHSLGAAIALLDGIYLTLQLPGVSVNTVGYGMPRVSFGSPSFSPGASIKPTYRLETKGFANYVDSHLSLTHINNKRDPIPTLPGRFLHYHHPSGEVHITETGSWDVCPGHDNPGELCTVGDVPTVLASNASDHSGPYNGIIMGC